MKRVLHQQNNPRHVQWLFQNRNDCSKKIVCILFFIVSDDRAKHEGSMWEKENRAFQIKQICLLGVIVATLLYCHCFHRSDKQHNHCQCPAETIFPTGNWSRVKNPSSWRPDIHSIVLPLCLRLRWYNSQKLCSNLIDYESVRSLLRNWRAEFQISWLVFSIFVSEFLPFVAQWLRQVFAISWAMVEAVAGASGNICCATDFTICYLSMCFSQVAMLQVIYAMVNL